MAFSQTSPFTQKFEARLCRCALPNLERGSQIAQPFWRRLPVYSHMPLSLTNTLFGREALTLPSDDTSLEPGRWAFVIHVQSPQGKRALNNPFRLLFSNSIPVVLGRITTAFKDKNYDHLKKKNSIVKDFSIVYSLLNILV